MLVFDVVTGLIFYSTGSGGGGGEGSGGDGGEVAMVVTSTLGWVDLMGTTSLSRNYFVQSAAKLIHLSFAS